MSEQLDLEAIRAHNEFRKNEASPWATQETREIDFLLAEVDRLRAERDGLGDTQSRGKWEAEQQATDLRHSLSFVRRELRATQTEVENAWTEGHKHPWRRDTSDCHCGAWSSIECGCGRYGNGALLSLADNPYKAES